MPVVGVQEVYAAREQRRANRESAVMKDSRSDARMSDGSDAFQKDQQPLQRKDGSQESVWLHWQIRPRKNDERA